MSPRGALGLQRAARALAASIGRSYVVPDDVKLLASSVLEHRLMLSSEAITRGVSAADVLASILESVAGAGGPARLTPMITRRGWALVGSAVGLFVAGRILGLVQLAVLAVAAVLTLLVGASCGCACASRALAGRRELKERLQVGVQGRVDIVVQPRPGRPRRSRSTTRSTAAAAPPASCSRRCTPGEEARAAYRFPTDRRGRYEVGPLRVTRHRSVRARASASRVVLGTEEVIVYPRVRDVLPPPEIGGLDLDREQPQVRSRIEPSGEFHTLREYAPGDDLRHVHWRSTARRGHLMMRQNEARRRTPVLVMLDVRPGAHDRASFERAVEACASIVTAIERARPAGRGDAEHRHA